MDWNDFAKLIIELGLPAAIKVWERWSVGGQVTAEDIAALRAEMNKTALDIAKERLLAKGIALDSPQAVELLELVG